MADRRFIFALGLAVSCAYWPGMLSGAVVPRWSVIAVGVPLLFAFDLRRLPPAIPWLLGALMAAALFSLRQSPDPRAGLLEAFFLGLLCLTMIGASQLESADDLMGGVSWGLGLSSIIAVLQWLGVGLQGITAIDVPAGLFFNSEVLGELSALVFVWALLRPRWWAAAFAFVPLVLCETRVGWMAAAAAIAWTFRPAKRWQTGLIVIGLGLLGAALLVALGIPKFGSAGQRLVIWGATVMAFTWTGNGLGWFQAAHPFEDFAHSDVLQAICEIGPMAIVGLVIAGWALYRKGGHRAERACFIAACLEACVSFPLHMPATGFVAASMAGVLLGAGHRLRLGEHHGRTQDVARVQRPDDAREGIGPGGQRGGYALPV